MAIERWEEFADEELVLAALLGEIAAFDVLVLRYRPGVLAAVSRQISNRGVAEDICQETFLLAFKALPQLNEQRRKELAKMVHKRVEEGRVAVRNIRRDCHDELRKLEKSHEAPEDEVRRTTDQLQKLTDQFIAEMDKAGKDKEAELMEV